MRRFGRRVKHSDFCQSTSSSRICSTSGAIISVQKTTDCYGLALSKIGVRLRRPEQIRPIPYLDFTLATSS